MKKLFLLSVILIIVVSTEAQFGVKAGLNIATLGGKDVDDQNKKALLGFYGGVFYNIKATDMISVQPELVYSGQGDKYSETDYELKHLLGYLNLTPLVRFNTSSGFFVGVGPQIGFLLSAKQKETGYPDVDVKDEAKGADFAVALALGYELENGFGVYARYNHGITTILDQGDDKVFNRVVQVGLRYRLNISK